MSFRENLRRGRSHIIFALVLLVATWIVLKLEDRDLNAVPGQRAPAAETAAPE
ncbi:MAG: hypothetical protein AB7O49_21530 [Sphingomonadales bacterium]